MATGKINIAVLRVLLLRRPCTSMGKGLFSWCPLGLEIEAFQKGMQNYVCMQVQKVLLS